AYQRERVNARRAKMSEDPWALVAIGEAASEIHASRTQLMTDLGAMYDMARKGETVPLSLRVQGRRDSVRSAWRTVRAVDDIFDHSGGAALRSGTPLQR